MMSVGAPLSAPARSSRAEYHDPPRRGSRPRSARSVPSTSVTDTLVLNSAKRSRKATAVGASLPSSSIAALVIQLLQTGLAHPAVSHANKEITFDGVIIAAVPLADARHPGGDPRRIMLDLDWPGVDPRG